MALWENWKPPRDSRETLTATIAPNGTVSSAVDLGARRLSGILWPAQLTGTSFTLQVSFDGITYKAARDFGGNPITIVPTADTISLLGDLLANLKCVRWIKLVSGTAEAAARSIGLQTSEY
jgi:hypothetical protein